MASSRVVVTCVATVLSVLVLWLYGRTMPAVADRATLLEELAQLFETRTYWLLDADMQACATFYDCTSRTGQWALQQEQRRISRVHGWAASRGIRLTGAEGHARVVAAGVSGDRGWASVCYNLILTYDYGQGPAPERMGVRTIHWLELVRRGDRWLIRRDWYWDPFGSGRPSAPAEGGQGPAAGVGPSPRGTPGSAVEPTAAPGPASAAAAATLGWQSPTGVAAGPGQDGGVPRGTYNREAAVAYADRYCGVAIPGSTGRYNQRYRDFTFLGGDCTNFVSQVLADSQAGGLPTDPGWSYRNGNPTPAWVRADAFVRHMLQTGRVRCLHRGTIAEAGPSLDRLRPGDLIAVEEKGTIEHLMVVVGRDHWGTPLVDSHSADRYHVPWDLGGDPGTVFWSLEVVP
jgi:hypothetical protein